MAQETTEEQLVGIWQPELLWSASCDFNHSLIFLNFIIFCF